MKSSLLRVISLLSLAIAVLTLPLVVPSAWRAIHSGINDVKLWVRPEFESRRLYEEFCADFGSGDMAVISWPGCTVDNPKLDPLPETLTALADVTAQDDPVNLVATDGSPFVDMVVTGREAYLHLRFPNSSLAPDLSHAEAVDRLSGTLVGPEGTTCVLVGLSPAASAERNRAISNLRAIVARECEVDVHELRIVGPALDAQYLNIATHSTLTRFGGLSAAITLLASVILLRSLRLGAIVFATAIYCQGVVLTLLYLAGDHLNAILIIMPTLLLVLGVSGGVHLANYYAAAVEGACREGGAARALRHGWLPCTLSAGTTAIGLASLLVSQVIPIRSFGWYGATGMIVTLLFVLLVVPGACEWSGATSRLWWGWNTDEAARQPTRVTRRVLLPRFLLRVPWVVVVVGVIMMVVAGFGLPALRTSVRIDTLFSEDSRLIQDYKWIEKNVGPLVPVEVLLGFDEDCELPFVDRFELIRRIERSLAENPRVGGTISAATFLPTPDSGPGISATARRSMAARVIERLGYLKKSDAGELWRVTARIGIFDDAPYEELSDDIRNRAYRIIKEATHEPEDEVVADAATGESRLADHGAGGEDATPDEKTDGIKLVITGMSPLADEIQRDLMKDLVLSFFSALVLIAVVMIIAQRSVVIGLAAMIPNVFPVVFLFGLLGWLNIPVDIGSVMTASVALGMAIDGTQHFVTFFREELKQGRSVERSVTAAYRHCSRAILISALVCGLGLLAFAASDFAAASRCSLIMMAAILTMTVGDLMLLPSILMLTGKLFLGRRSAGAAPAPAENSSEPNTRA